MKSVGSMFLNLICRSLTGTAARNVLRNSLVRAGTNGTDETIRFAIQTYGKDAQTLMLFEEMAELQDAICKHSRGRDKNHHVCEEIADVMIMCLQMAQIYGVKCVGQWLDFKMNRLSEKLK